MTTCGYRKSLIKVTHLPSGYTVECDTRRSQHQNRKLCIDTIKAKLYADDLGLEIPMIDDFIKGSLCPICERGTLELQQETVIFKNPTVMYYYLCTYCGSEQVDATLAELNVLSKTLSDHSDYMEGMYVQGG